MSNDNLENVLNRDRQAEVNPQAQDVARNFDTHGPDMETAGQTTSQAQVSTEEGAAATSLSEDDEAERPTLPVDGELLEPQRAADQTTGAQGNQAGAVASPDRGADQHTDDLKALVDERTTDLKRLQAEYVNYKKRVDRDRLLSRQAGVESVVLDLVPVLDSIELARQHNDLGEGFQLVADSLTKLSAKHGLTSFGAVGERFDPTLHEALMQVPLPSGQPVDEVTISQVMQVGYKLGDRVLRPARVGVANPS